MAGVRGHAAGCHGKRLSIIGIEPHVEPHIDPHSFLMSILYSQAIAPP